MTPFYLFFSICLLLLGACRGDLDPASFEQEVLRDDRVWLIEFYSPMCGSCTEFTPTWTRLQNQMISIATGKINIDEEKGMALAQKLGVLDEGLPNIRMFSSNSSPNVGVAIMPGDILPHNKIVQAIKANVAGLERRDDGFYLKKA